MEYETLLKITRKRTVMYYLHRLEFWSLMQGDSNVKTTSLRWKRLQWCCNSVEWHILNELSLFGYKI